MKACEMKKFWLHAEASDGNPVQCWLDQVVTNGINDDRHWIGQCSSEHEVEVQLPLAQQINVQGQVLSRVRSKANREYPALNSSRFCTCMGSLAT